MKNEIKLQAVIEEGTVTDRAEAVKFLEKGFINVFESIDEFAEYLATECGKDEEEIEDNLNNGNGLHYNIVEIDDIEYVVSVDTYMVSALRKEWEAERNQKVTMKKQIKKLMTYDNATLRISQAFQLRVHSNVLPSHKKALRLELLNAEGKYELGISINSDLPYDELIKVINDTMASLMNSYLESLQKKLRGGLLYKNTINVIGGEDKAENKLKNMRLKMGMSQEELAYMSEVSYRSIRAYETGSRDISKASVTTLNKLAEALNCTVADLL